MNNTIRHDEDVGFTVMYESNSLDEGYVPSSHSESPSCLEDNKFFREYEIIISEDKLVQ